MNTLTNKDKLALQVSLALVAGMFSLVPVAHGAPVLEGKVTAETNINQSADKKVTTVTSASGGNNVINWKDFSVARDEKVIFDATSANGSTYTKTNNYLNIVTGNGTSYIDGAVKGGKNVYLVNPHGVIMGKGADIDVGNLYVSTKALNPDDFADTNLSKSVNVLGSTVGDVQEDVVNMGKIQANKVYAEGRNIRFLNTADITTDGSNKLTDVTLKSSNDGYVHVGYDSATGTKASELYSNSNIIDYKLVYSKTDLDNINSSAANLSDNYMLAKDIELTYTNNTTPNFSPIGKSSSNAFKGRFDGNFFSIKNIVIPTKSKAQYAGLFGFVDGARVENVRVVDATIASVNASENAAGGIAGYAKDTTFINIANSVTQKWTKDNIYVKGQIATNSDDAVSFVGGLVGYATGTTSISSSYNQAAVLNGSGLIGKINGKKVELSNSYNDGPIINRRTNNETGTYYGGYGGVAEASKITNVYNSGQFYKLNSTTYKFDDADVQDVGPSGGTNVYSMATSKSASGYAGIFSSTDNGVNKTWRIYEGHSLPLLRSFLKANGQGTITVGNYDLGLYKNATTDTASATITGYGSNEIVYNGYYVGATNVQSDTSRAYSDANTEKVINSDYIKSARLKNVVDNAAFFYSENQNGYDIADSTISITKRNLIPASGLTLTKVYDGTADATKEMQNAFGANAEAIDVAAVYAATGNLIETGLVKTYDKNGVLTAESVSLADGAIQSATYYKKTNPVNKANWASGNEAINVADATSASPATVEVKFASGNAAIKADENIKTDGTTADYTNYTLNHSGFDDGSVPVNGIITKRPVYVGLKDTDDHSKTYDGTEYVIYNGTTTIDDSGNPVYHLDANVKVEDKDSVAVDTGLTGNDGVSVVLSKAYYSTDGTEANATSAANATNGTLLTGKEKYKEVYALGFSDEDKAGNYEFINTADNTNLSSTNNALISDKIGIINKRNVTLDKIAFYDDEGNLVDNKKTYDFTSKYGDAETVSFTSDGQVSVQNAVNNYTTYTSGVVETDKGSFEFGLDKDETKFYNGSTTAATEAKTVSDASYIKYVLKTKGDADVLSNYTLNGENISTTGTVPIFREGQIEKRAITVDMLTSTDIDKVYDNTADVVDKDSKGYLGFKGTGATGTVSETSSAPTLTTKGYVGYGTNTANKLVVDDVDSSGKSLNDGTTFAISAAYTTAGAENTGSTTNAADVYYVDSDHVAEDKKITYTVTLTGDYADNYTLNGESATTSGDTTTGPTAELSATGAITPRQITGITFGDVIKSYDGSAAVGEVNGVTQTGNQITIGGVTIDTSDGVTANSSGLIGSDTYDAVLGTTGGVLKDSSTISGTYGTPGWTIASTDAFQGDAHAHNGADRKVQYTGVSSITSDNHNYTTVGMDDTQYGDGTIKPLKIDTLSASGDGNITKVYDGTTNVVGGYRVQYEISTSTNPGQESDIVGTLVKHQNDASDVKTALGTITGTGTGEDGTSKVSVDFGGSAYTVDEANTVYNSTHVDGASKITYAVSLDNTNGDYVLAESTEATNSGYISYGIAGTGVKIDKTGSGLITARNVYTQGVTGLSKTYDGDTKVKNSGGTELTGDSVVTFNAKDNYSGLTGNDNVTNVSTAAYSGDTRTNYDAKDANVYKDGVQTTAEGAKYVTYTVKLSDNSHGDYVIYKNTNGDSYYAPGSEYTLSGNNITQADLKVSFGDVSKNYDTNAKVVGAVSESTDAVVNGTKTGDTVAFATKDTSAFLAGTTENPSAAAADVGTHQVQYDLVSTSADLKNYRLVGSDGTTALSVSKNNDGSYNVTAYGKGTISPLTIKSITAAIDAVTKVYDGTAALTYDHNAAGGYDSTQVGSASSSDSVHSINLGGLALQENTGKYTVNDDSITIGGSSIAGTQFADSNAGNGKSITYRITINKDVVKNLTIDADAVQDADSSIKVYKNEDTGEYVITKTTNDNTIKAKNAYAYLNSNGLAADPSKVYDGNTNAVSADTAKSYVTVNGLAGGDGYTVSSAYESKDVAVENGQAAISKNNIDYTVALGNNYNLYTVDETGNIFTHDGNHATADTGYNYDKETGHLTKDTAPAAVLDTTNDMSALVANPTKVLVGTGTITPKEITLDATLAKKTYDANADVKLSVTETDDVVPSFTLSGLIAAGDLTVATTGDNAISGKYGNYADGAFTADDNVALDSNNAPTYKAVQYGGVAGALTAGNSAVTNYKLAGSGDANSVYNPDDDTWTFLAGANKGLITRRSISDIRPEWKTVTKEYDATEAVLNPTEGFKVYGVSNVGNTETKIPIAYNLDQAVYGTLNANRDGLASTNKNVGTDLSVAYKISGLKAEALQNFELGSDVSADGYNRWISQNVGTITQRIISGKATDVVQDKVYGQDYGTGNLAAALSNGTYFNIDSDDLEVLNKDGKDSTALTVSGVYADKNANHNPGETATSHKDVNFTIGWAANQTDTGYQSNYTFDTNNGTGSDYIGKGDIQKRIVYVNDNGGTVQEKTYDGSPALTSTIPSDKFTLNVASGGDTGVIAGDNVTLDSDAITGAYASKDVARDSSGKVVNKAVNYSGFALKDGDSTDDTGNYYLMADSGINSVALTNSDGETVNSAVTYANDATTGALTITEKQGGLIKPKEVTISIASPEKPYDATTDVETADMAGSNLTAKADGQDVSKHFDSANNAVLELNPGTGTDEVTVKVNSGSYDTKDVSVGEDGNVLSNKTTTLNVSWNNGNYDLVAAGGEEDGIAGQANDTFKMNGTKGYANGYTSNTDERTGVLKDYQSIINPLELSISSISSEKTYDGNTGYSYGLGGSPSTNKVNVSFGTYADAVIQKDISMSDDTTLNNTGFLGLTIANGTYGAATDAEVAAVTAASDAAKDENSSPFTHSTTYSDIAIDTSNPNYKLATTSASGTGIINRATVTATPSPASATIKSGQALPGYTGSLDGFIDGETITVTEQVPVTSTVQVLNADGNPTYDEAGNPVTQEVTDYVDTPVTYTLKEYYEKQFKWEPESSSVGTNPVYGWYGKKEIVDGEEVVNYYKESNLGKNYVLAQNPGELVVQRNYSGGGGGGSSSTTPVTPVIPVTPVTPVTPVNPVTPAATKTEPATPTTPAATPTETVAVVDIGYVEKPTTPDSSVYHNVSKDFSSTADHSSAAAIQYGEKTMAVSSENGEVSSSGTIAIEVAEVVNLLGDDVASDGTMSLTNTGDGQALSVESTENGYLSVGSAGSEGSIGIETEGGIVSADNGEREGTIGLETEGSLLNADNGEKEGTISLETEEGVLNANGTDKEGTIGLETEDEVLLDTEQGKELLSTTSSDEESGTTKEGSISIKSSSKDGEAEITSAGSRLAKADEVQEKDEDKDKEDEEEKNSEEESNKEGEAAIAYSDVA